MKKAIKRIINKIEGSDINYFLYLFGLFLAVFAMYKIPINKEMTYTFLLYFVITTIGYILFPWVKTVLDKEYTILDYFIERVYILVISFSIFYPIAWGLFYIVRYIKKLLF